MRLFHHLLGKLCFGSDHPSLPLKKVFVMSNELTAFNFESNEIRVVPDGNGKFHIVAKDVLTALGIDTSNVPSKIGHVPEEWKGRSPVATPGGVQNMAVLTEQGLYFFVNRSDKPKALPFQKWVAGEVIPSIRETGKYEQPSAASFNLDIHIAYLKTVAETAEILRASEPSRVNMIKWVCDKNGLDPGFLPSYTETESPVFSLTHLLKEKGIGRTAAKLNPVLNSMGILEQKERESRSSKTGTKKFWSLSERGLKYGKNEVSEKNVRETQPLYYETTFDELMREVEMFEDMFS